MSGKNSIQVAIKVRPASKKEKDQQIFWRVVDNSIQLSDSPSEPYYFDHIFDQDATNQIIFDKVAKQIVHSAVRGFNGTIFAYGQTSSGKTYTMMGDEGNPGVMVLAAKEIFKEIEKTADRQFLLRVGYIEIYNEKIYDLLNKKNQDLKIHETPTGIVSVNCEEIIIRSEGDLLTYLEKGGKERTVGETNMNERSSRSHAIFRIIIESRKMERNEDDAVIQSVINLVDLAGSERADQTGARGTRLKEGGHINKSLLFLSNVIKRLSENEDDKYISFRDSKLTRILQASLGGNALTTIICTIKPNAIEETQSTINFALRAKAIKNKPEVNEIISDATMMKRLEQEIKVLKSRLEDEQRKNESQLKVRQLEQRIRDEDLKIISCTSIRNREKRRRTWCPSSTNLDANIVNQQKSALPLSSGIPQPSRLQAPKTSYFNTPHITTRILKESPHEPQRSSFLPIPPDFPEVDEEFAPAESINFEKLSPMNTPSNVTSTTSITPKLIGCEKSTLRKVENDFEELQRFTNYENKMKVEPEPLLALKHKVETLTQRNVELEKERCKFLLLEQEIEAMAENLTDYQSKVESLTQRNAELEEKGRLENLQLKKEIETASKSLVDAENRFDELQVQLTKLTTSNKMADEKIAKYEAELAELKKTNEKLEIENREAVNLEFAFKSHKNKSKLRENELLEAVNEKDKEIKKLEKSINVLTAERLENAKAELLQRSLDEDGKADEDGKVCIKCEDIQRLLDENKKITLEFEKLTLEYEQFKINTLEMEKEYEANKLKIGYMEELQEKERVEHEKLQQENEKIKNQLMDTQTQFEDLQKENEDLSNELIDNLQESDHIKIENIKLKDKLKDYEDKNKTLSKGLAEIIEHECSSEKDNVLNTPSLCHRNSSMRNSLVCIQEEDVDSTQCQELLNKFYEISDSLTEIELQNKKGNSILFKTTSRNSAANCYKMYLKNILGVQEFQKEFGMEVENVYLQGFFTHHSFHIIQLSDEDKIYATESNIIDMNGCQNINEYVEKLKQDITELKIINESINQDRLNNKSLLESTERVLGEMKEQIKQLSSELLEKSMFVEKCACKSYQQQIENLVKEKTDITIVYEELQEKINSTMNGSLLLNNSVPPSEIKTDFDDKMKEIDYDSQTKVLEEITQRCVDMEADLEIAREELKNQEIEFREKYNKLKLENLQKLELSTNEYRDNIKKYNKEWEENREQYQQTIKDLQNQINILKRAVDVETEIKPENISRTKLAENEVDKSNLDVAPESATNNRYQDRLVQEEETNKDKSIFEEQKCSVEQQLNEAEELLASMKAENRIQCDEINLLNTKIIDLEKLLADAKRLHETINEENSSLRVEINNIREGHNCIPDLHAPNQQLSEEMDKLQQEYNQLEDKLRKTESQLQEFCHEDKRREILIQTLQNKITGLTAIEEEKNNLSNDFGNLKEQYNQVQDKLQKAEQQIQEFCIEDSRREELMQTLQTKLDNLRAEEDERKTLETEIQELKATLNCLQEKDMENSNEISSFKNKVEMLLHRVSDLENVKSSLLLEKTALEEQLKQISGEVNVLQSVKLSLELQLDTLTEERKSVLETFSLLQENKTSLEEHLKEFKEEKAEFENKVDCITEALKKPKNHLVKNEMHDEEEKVKIQQDIQSLVENIEEKSEQLKGIEKLQQDNANIHRDLQTLEQDFIKAIEEKEKHLQQVEEHHQEIIQLKKDLKNRQQEKQELQLTLDKFRQEQNNQKIQEFSSKLAEEQKRNQELEQQLTNLNAVLVSFKEEQRKTIDKNTCLKTELEETKESLTKLQREHRHFQESSSKLVEQQRQNQELEQQLKYLNTALASCKEDHHKATERSNCLQTELQATKEILTKVQKENLSLEESSSKLVEQQKQNQKLEEQLKDLNTALGSCKEDHHKAIEKNNCVENELQATKEVLMKVQKENLSLEESSSKLVEQQKLNQELEEQLKDLNTALGSCKEDHHKAIEKNNCVENELQATKEVLMKVQKENRSLQESSSKLVEQQKQNQELEEQLKDLNTALASCKKDHHKTIEKNNCLQTELQATKESLTKVQKENLNLQESSSKLFEQQKQNRELEQKLKKLNMALASCKEDRRKTVEKNNCLQTEIQKSKESLTKLQKEQLTLQEKLVHYQKLQEDKNKLELTLNNLKKDKNGALSCLQDEKEKLLKSLKQYEEENNAYKEKEETLKQKIEQLYQQMHEMRCKFQSYEKLILEREEEENILTLMTASNEKLQKEISELTSQKDDHISQIDNLTNQIEKLKTLLKSQTDEKQILQSELLHLKETLQADQVSLQKEYEDLKSTLLEIQLKCDSLQLSNNQLENLNKQLDQQLNSAKEKLKEFHSMQEELKTVKAQYSELQQSLKKTVEEAGRCSLALREDVERHKELLEKQMRNYTSMKIEMETKQNSLSEENIKLSASIEELKKEKLLLEKNLRDITVRNFEYDLQRHAMDATPNSSLDSNVSHSPKGCLSLERKSSDKVSNASLDEKLSAIQQKNIVAERKNRRLSTHDERRRQSYWGAAYDKATMTDSLDTSCNCAELDRKLKECERDLFIKSSQVTALNMELKNHPLKEENATLKKRLQEEQDKHRNEIKRCKSKLHEQSVKAEKAIAAAAHAKAKSAYDATSAALAAEQLAKPLLPIVLCDADVQTDDDFSTSLHKLQGKYNDLKQVCRYRNNVIKDLEEKVSQKENSDGNSLPPLDASHLKIMKKQYQALQSDMSTMKTKYEHCKNLLQSRREEILKLRAELDQINK